MSIKKIKNSVLNFNGKCRTPEHKECMKPNVYSLYFLSINVSIYYTTMVIKICELLKWSRLI